MELQKKQKVAATLSSSVLGGVPVLVLVQGADWIDAACAPCRNKTGEERGSHKNWDHNGETTGLDLAHAFHRVFERASRRESRNRAEANTGQRS